MNPLINELKIKIIDTLCLTDVQPGDIDENGALVGGDLGIDSIDILDLVMMIEESYSVRIDSKQLGIKVFSSLTCLADYIGENRPRS